MSLEPYLQDLRRERFSPNAWIRYARRVAAHIREELDANPGAVRSIWSVALAFFAVAFLAAVGMSVGYDRRLAYSFFLHTSVWILPAFLFVTLCVGLLRDRDGYRLSSLNVPLVLTLTRITLVPGITLFLVERHFMIALVTYVVASLTDVVDGYVARRWNQVTPLGVVLDPLVDVAFNLAMYAGLAAAELLSPWVFYVAALRYGLLLVGAAALYLFIGPVRIQSTFFGRLSGVITTSLVALFTLLVAVRGSLAQSLTPLTEIALGVLLSATVVQVLLIGWWNIREMTGTARTQGRVVQNVRWRAR